MPGNAIRVITVLVLALISYTDRMGGAESGATITGVVKTASEEPAPGAMVKVRSAERGVTVTVISQERGLYKATNLPPGKYTVQGFGGGFQSEATAAVELDGGRTITVDLTLAAMQDFWQAITASHSAEILPEGEGKLLVATLCGDCHQSGFVNIFSSRKDGNAWREAVEKMGDRPYGYCCSVQMTEKDKKGVVEYLAQHFSPDAPPLDTKRYHPKTWVQDPQARRYMVTEYELLKGADPHDVAVDSRGTGWVNERARGFLGRFDPNTWTYTRIPLPDEKSSSPNAIAIDEHDRVWVSDGKNNRLVQYDPKTLNFTIYPLRKPPRGNAGANTIRFHPNGTVWLTGISANQIMGVDPGTKETVEYPVPSAGRPPQPNVQPYGMAIDGNQMVWFAEYSNSKMGKLDPKTGRITEYDLATGWLARPRRMGTDAEGNVWVAEFGDVGKLARIDYRTSKITEYPTPTKYSGPYSVDVDKTRNFIWFNEFLANKIARFDPRTKTFVEYPLPTPYEDVRRIEVDRTRPNRIWFTGGGKDKIGYLDVIE